MSNNLPVMIPLDSFDYDFSSLAKFLLEINFEKGTLTFYFPKGLEPAYDVDEMKKHFSNVKLELDYSYIPTYDFRTPERIIHGTTVTVTIKKETAQKIKALNEEES